MKQTRRANESLRVERVINKTTTTIWLSIEGKRTMLFKTHTSDTFWLNYIYDKNFIIVYSRGCMANQIPLKIEIAYDIKRNKIINISEENAMVFEHVYVSSKAFDTSVVLQYLNSNDLEITSVDKLKSFEEYITGKNRDIPKEDVIDYIVKQEPRLKEFLNIDIPLSVNKYHAILNTIGTNTFWFNIMPQALDKIVL